MSADKIWIESPEGEPILVSYEDLDPDTMGVFARPTGKFSYAAEDFKRLHLPKVPFYLQDWLPVQGKAMIYGPKKTGKSFLALQVARAIGAGEPFLGRQVQQGRTLYMQFELGPSVLLGRMNETDQVYEDVYVGTIFTMKLDTPEGQQVLLDELALVRPNVLILDPLYKIMGGDENEVQDTMVVLDFLDRVLDMYSEDRLSILIMHHSGKDETRGARGTSALEGWVDASIQMKRTSGENDKILAARLIPKALRHAPPDESLDIVLGPKMEFLRGSEPRRVIDEVREYILDNGPCKLQEVLDAGIGSRRSVYDARKELLDSDVIESWEDGYRVKEKE